MAERMDDGGGTKVEQDGQPERAGPERAEAVEPERRPTYKTLDEQQGRLTETEERFERGRRTIGLFLGPLVFLLLLVLPLDLDGKQQGLAAVLGLVVTWWITEAIPIPITGVVGLCLCVVLNFRSKTEACPGALPVRVVGAAPAVGSLAGWRRTIGATRAGIGSGRCGWCGCAVTVTGAGCIGSRW